MKAKSSVSFHEKLALTQGSGLAVTASLSASAVSYCSPGWPHTECPVLGAIMLGYLWQMRRQGLEHMVLPCLIL